MFERITYMSDEYCTIKLSETEKVTQNLMNLHLIFQTLKLIKILYI